jgi:hypothetical protein
MKIAVCFSGQMRTGIENYPNIKEFFGESYNDCDFFIHTWNFSEYKTYNGSNIAKKPIIESDEKFDEIKKLYSPKKMIVDIKHIGYETAEKYGIQPLWYSFWKSIELKKQYEIENNFKYDYVIKIRPDLVLNYNTYDDLIKEINTTYENEFKIIGWDGFDVPKNTQLATDVFFISKSNEMNIAADYFWSLMKYYDNNNYTNLPSYLKEYNIKSVKSVYINRFILLREIFIEHGVLKLSKLDMLNKITELEKYYFDSCNLSGEKYFINELLIEIEKRKIVLDMNKKYYLEDLL